MKEFVQKEGLYVPVIVLSVEQVLYLLAVVIQIFLFQVETVHLMHAVSVNINIMYTTRTIHQSYIIYSILSNLSFYRRMLTFKERFITTELS